MNKNVAKKKRVTLEMIEDHLEKQDIGTSKAVFLVPIGFAASIILSGVSLITPAGGYGLIIVGFLYFGLVYWTYRKVFKRKP